MSFKPESPPTGCVNAEEHERRLTSLADKLESATNDLLSESGNGILISRAKEMSLAAVRARRAAAELAVKRLEIEHTNWLVKEARALGGLGLGNRKPLKRRAQ